MKRKIIASSLLICILATLLCPVAFASGDKYHLFSRINDISGVLTDDETELLEEEIGFIIEEYETDFQFILIGNDEFGKSGFKTYEELAEHAFKDENHPGGYGEDSSGIVTVILTDRKYFGFYGSGKGEILASDNVMEQIYNDTSIDSLIAENNYFSVIMSLMVKYESVLTNKQDVSAGLSAYENKTESVSDTLGIIDESDVLNESEEAKLLSDIELFREEYGADLLLIFADNTESRNEEELADILIDYYNGFGYGIGENGDGIALLVDTSERLYFINYFGENYDNGTENTVYIGNKRRSFDYETRLYIDGFVQSKLEEDDFCGAANELIRLSGAYLNSGHMPIEPMEILIALGIGLIIAFLVTVILKKKMKPVTKAAFAGEYLVRDTLRMRAVIPIFIRSSVTRTAKSSSSSGGGGGSHSGAHGTGTGGRF